MADRLPVIIDTDVGIDDAQALLVILTEAQQPSSQIEIVAITSVAGNVDVAAVTVNIGRVLEVFEEAHPGVKAPPLFTGCDVPIVQPPSRATEWHGHDGLGGVFHSDVKPDLSMLQTEHAATAMGRIVMASQKPVRFLLLGPQTNLALAVRLQPLMVANTESVVFMGGAHSARGNVTTTAEFNVYADPEAAAIVLSTFPKTVMVSWELTMDCGLDWEFLDTWMGGVSVKSKFIGDVSKHLVDASKASVVYAPLGFLIPDVLAAAVCCRPEIVTKSVRKPVVVELLGKHTRGMTVVAWDAEPGSIATEIVQTLDMTLLKQLIVASVV